MSENSNGKFRPRRVNFATVSNLALQDSRLSLKSKGLYSIIQCYINKPNYELRKYVLVSLCKEGQKAFDAAWKELKDAGYLKIYRIPSGKNDKFEYEYELLDEADENTPALINLNKKREVIPPKDKNPEQENEPSEQNQHTPQKGVYANPEPGLPESSHPPQKGVYANCQENENNNSHTPHFAPYANGNLCEPHVVPNGGNIRNTESRNTYLRNTKSVSPSIDGLTDEIRKSLKEQIEYDYFEDNYPEDISGIDAVVDCMVDLLSSHSTKINGTIQSREALEVCLSRVDSCTIREFLEHMKKQDLSGIRNINAYYKSSLVNFIREQEIRLLNA